LWFLAQRNRRRALYQVVALRRRHHVRYPLSAFWQIGPTEHHANEEESDKPIFLPMQ
jgi:hypothetical protein